MFLVWFEIRLIPIWKMSSHVMSAGFRLPPTKRRSSVVSFLHELHHRWPSFLGNRLLRPTFRPVTAQWGFYLLQFRDEGKFNSVIPVRRGERPPRTTTLPSQCSSRINQLHTSFQYLTHLMLWQVLVTPPYMAMTNRSAVYFQVK
jgi:hypothetical protein